jgi:hypothetical protein
VRSSAGAWYGAKLLSAGSTVASFTLDVPPAAATRRSSPGGPSPAAAPGRVGARAPAPSK